MLLAVRSSKGKQATYRWTGRTDSGKHRGSSCTSPISGACSPTSAKSFNWWACRSHSSSGYGYSSWWDGRAIPSAPRGNNKAFTRTCSPIWSAHWGGQQICGLARSVRHPSKFGNVRWRCKWVRQLSLKEFNPLSKIWILKVLVNQGLPILEFL